MRYWWVNHGASYRAELSGGYVWCPQVRDGDRSHNSWANVARIAAGDTIFSYAKGSLRAVGSALSSAKDVPARPGYSAPNWQGMGWGVDVGWVEFFTPVSPRDYLAKMAPLLPEKHSPIRKENGYGNQSYMHEISLGLATYLMGLLEDLDPHCVLALDEAMIDNLAPNDTTKQRLYDSRIGQGAYRQSVLAIERACRLTGVSDDSFLVASHIKPWRDSDNSERLDGNNGLMLSPHVDRLFDRGYISFTDEGQVLVASPSIKALMRAWGLNTSQKSRPFLPRQCEYLAYHRAILFRRHDSPKLELAEG